MSNKKSFSTFNDDINDISRDIDNITDDLKDDNKINDYNSQINNIKSNVQMLETELKSFIDEMKNAPLIEKAKEEIKRDSEELAKKYSKYDQIRARIIDMIENRTVLSKEEQNNFNLPTFYLSYILFAINAELKNDKKSLNNSINQATKLNSSFSPLLLSLAYLKLNNNNESIKWLDKFLLTINPRLIDEFTVSILENLSHYRMFYTKMNEYFNNWSKMLNEDEDLSEIIQKNIKVEINKYNPLVNDDEFLYVNNYCLQADTLLKSYTELLKYDELYADINSYGNTDSTDLFERIINFKDGKELYLNQNIAKNEAFLLNKPYFDNSNIFEKSNIYTILVNALFSRTKDYNFKHLSLHFLKDYLLEALNKNDDEINNIVNLNINDLSLEVDLTRNRKDIIEDMIYYVREPFKKEYDKLKLLNTKTIYSFVFAFIGIIVAVFNSTIGIAMFVIGLLALIYFSIQTNVTKNEIHALCLETIDLYEQELNKTLDEIDHIYKAIETNKSKKEELINLIASS